MNKVVWLIVLVVVAGGLFFFLGSGTSVAPDNAPLGFEEPTEGPGADFGPEEDAGFPVESSNVIIFNGVGFIPELLEINAGDIVTFKNEASKKTWPASDVHPSHSAYPTTGGCIGSTFDACAGIANGESWSFTFEELGEWNYHDHLSSGKNGKIIVK